ncbi:unnamed protein product [Didymodactylos carnosus]|uniref:NIF3-like protein 1 n=1 Tax=Didymodactylos carnosus TaxID=1234261 RepID=A0A8S2K7U7_9BILA|nr:unnamed protein product [Didymodactylos carnosus]CAF3839181.1 unnamed protein product [Didymodactylos carnosus]
MNKFDENNGIHLQTIVSELKKFAPLYLADEKWDNVGLLVEPDISYINTILLTNDLTEPVINEAIEKNVQLIISYHPLIFSGMKRLIRSNWKDRIILKCIENRIAIYSPHTSWDGVENGVNQWLTTAFGKVHDDFDVTPIETLKMEQTPGKNQHILTIVLPGTGESIQRQLNDVSGAYIQSETECLHNNLPSKQLMVACSKEAVISICNIFKDNIDIFKTIQIVDVQKPLDANTGYGRLVELKQTCTISEIVEKVKNLTSLKYVRLALASGKSITSSVRTIAVCAGSGSTVLSNVRADIYFTGEMSHHAVLDAIHRGTTVILCEHTNTERGFLKQFRKYFMEIWEGKMNIILSEKDKDPLEIV